ncbi:MAG: hypothetical protein KF832_28980 [Caldilineaceae bacterium]|nr:hypothetical protein [Caldilineaceae bacterium]
MSKAVQAQAAKPIEIAQAWSYPVAALLVDARPLRALFEELAFAVRANWPEQGSYEPQLTVTIDLQAANQSTATTVVLPLESESAGVCAADPLPLDAQALRQALALFQAAQPASWVADSPIHVVCLCVKSRVKTLH